MLPGVAVAYMFFSLRAHVCSTGASVPQWDRDGKSILSYPSTPENLDKIWTQRALPGPGFG